MRKKVDEATALLFNEREIAQKILEDARKLMNPVKDSIHDAETIKTLHLEVENLKASTSYIRQFARLLLRCRISTDIETAPSWS